MSEPTTRPGDVPAPADGPARPGSARTSEPARTRDLARTSGLAQAIGEQFSLQAATGGVRGMVEAVLPIGVFSLVYAIRGQLWPSVLAAVGVSVVLLLARLVARQPVNQALSGLLGIALGAGVALYTGRAVDFFSVTIVKNIALLLLYLGSSLIRWPFVGVLLGFALGEGIHWRQVPARMRVYQIATWIWVGMCVVRLAVEIPLYLKEHTTELGALQLPLGVPLYALVLLLTWLVVRRVPRVQPPEPEGGQPWDTEESAPVAEHP